MIASRARAMRKAMTEPEIILWTRLRGRGGKLPTFRRQHPLGATILDFYCPRFRLALEIDGSTHWDDEAQLKDAARDRWLARQGVQVLRISASRVYRDIHGVMDEITLKIAALERGGQV
ncbi:endonuclease domain-containing protein [Phenylobacterium sp. CCH9-H3]|uniref:endonuclease domain-containing protein n=1 Tax=Phenylobacterium sp. CCH9-H3 TaxID=1768774 RepID=UPI0021013131|nr:endonuclease domain-containing protein [Phenylobacterium sp. CCH9-H3]